MGRVIFILLACICLCFARGQTTRPNLKPSVEGLVWVKPGRQALSRTYIIVAGLWGSEVRISDNGKLKVTNRTCIEELKIKGKWKTKDSLLIKSGLKYPSYRIASYRGFSFLVPLVLVPSFQEALADRSIQGQFSVETKNAIGFSKKSDLRFVYSARL